MIPAAFDYAAPGSLDEALAVLADRPDEAKLLAGGHSLLPLMKLRLAMPGLLVDLGKIPHLRYIEDRGDHVAIGAMTTHDDVAESETVRRQAPLLAEAAAMVGDMQVRNRGTLAGSLAHADPAADMPAVAVALGAQVVARSRSGERVVGAADFFVDIWTSVLQPDEIVTEIRIPVQTGRAQTYEKFRQRAGDWAIVGVAVNVARHNGAIGDAGVVLTNVGPIPMRAHGVEAELRGQAANAETVRRAAEQAAEGLEPSPELKASPDYKRHLARVLTRRALDRALQLS